MCSSIERGRAINLQWFSVHVYSEAISIQHSRFYEFSITNYQSPTALAASDHNLGQWSSSTGHQVIKQWTESQSTSPHLPIRQAHSQRHPQRHQTTAGPSLLLPDQYHPSRRSAKKASHAHETRLLGPPSPSREEANGGRDDGLDSRPHHVSPPPRHTHTRIARTPRVYCTARCGERPGICTCALRTARWARLAPSEGVWRRHHPSCFFLNGAGGGLTRTDRIFPVCELCS